MLVCRETDSLGCVNCVEKGWNKMENKVTVVLADANEEFRTMLRQRMEGTGEFHVAGSTENGDQALDLVRRLRPQLLVTDVVLPGLDGFGLLRQLNQLGQGAPRTIVVSSFCSRRTVAQAMEMGVYFFLPKPVNEESACVKIGHIFFCFSRIIGFSPTVISYFFSKAYHPACLATAFMISSVKSS